MVYEAKLDRILNELRKYLNSFLINLDTCFGEARYKNNSVCSALLRFVYKKEMYGSLSENLQTGRANKRRAFQPTSGNVRSISQYLIRLRRRKYSGDHRDAAG